MKEKLLILFIVVFIAKTIAIGFTCCVIQNVYQPQFTGVYCTNCLCEGLTGWQGKYSYNTYDCSQCNNYSASYEPPKELMHFAEEPTKENEKKVATNYTMFVETTKGMDLEVVRKNLTRMHQHIELINAQNGKPAPPQPKKKDPKQPEACGPYLCCYYSQQQHEYLEPTICRNLPPYWPNGQVCDYYEGMSSCGQWMDGQLEGECFLVYKENGTDKVWHSNGTPIQKQLPFQIEQPIQYPLKQPSKE